MLAELLTRALHLDQDDGAHRAPKPVVDLPTANRVLASDLCGIERFPAQRDYFGAHTYERVDRPRGERFHTDWTESGGAVSSTAYDV